MSDSQTGMEVEGEPDADATGADVAMPEAQTTNPAEGAGARSIAIHGGIFKKPVFGDKHVHTHIHHHYYNERYPSGTTDQPGTSSGRHNEGQHGRLSSQASQGSEAEEHIVSPRQGQETGEGTRKKLTDTLFVDMDPKNKLSKTAFVYTGYQWMGEVCPPRPTAVKIVQYEKSRKREARNLLKLTPHSNVVLVIHADLVPRSSFLKQIYIVMEQCQRLTLEEYIENRHKNAVPFNTKQALDFARQIISGLKHIHSKDIVHRDLKPSSVLFSLDGKNLKIIDFGVSKELENGLTTMSVSTRIGTDGYRAPETYKDKTNRHMKKPADVFSLGILLCHIWSYGLHPFGEDGTLWAYNIKKGNPPNLRILLIPELEKAKKLIQHMLEVDQDKRCTVIDVEKDEYISQGIDTTLLSEMDNVWTGPVKITKSYDNSQPFSCKLYERKEKNILGIREQSAHLQMLYVPLTRMTNHVKGVINSPPNGYLAVSKDVYLKRLKKKFSKQMGWINAFKNKDRVGAFIMFKPREYEELLCIFIEKPEEFLNGLRVATAAEEETVPKQTDEVHEPEQESLEQDTPALQPTTDESEQPADQYQDATVSETPHHGLLRAIQGDYEDRPEDDEEEEETGPFEVISSNREVEIGQPEYISWWLYRPTHMGEQASSQTGQ